MSEETNTPPGRRGHGGAVLPDHILAAADAEGGDPNLVHPLWVLAQSVTPERYEDVLSAWAYARHAHSGQVDKVGNDYFRAHVTEVTLRAAMISPLAVRDDVIIAALLHDVVEDTTVNSYEEGRELQSIAERWGPEVEANIDALTQRKTGRWFSSSGQRWPELERRNTYLRRCCARPVSTVVKFADHLTNSDPARLALIPDAETRERLQDKYRPEGKRLRRAFRRHFDELPGIHGRARARENEMGDRT